MGPLVSPLVTDLLLKYSDRNIFEYFISELDMSQGRELALCGHSSLYTSYFSHFFIATSRMIQLQLTCDLLVARMHKHSYSCHEFGH